MLTRSKGFTLIEVTVVVAIIGLLLGSLLLPLATQVRATKVKATDRDLEEIREALIGFAMTNGRLPCPDTDVAPVVDGIAPIDGIENRAGVAACTANEGVLPYVTLGTSPVDAWGHVYHYRVSAAFAQPASPGSICSTADALLGLCDNGDIEIHGRDGATKAERDFTETAAAVVISRGPNGFGGFDIDGRQRDAPPANTDELENSDGDTVYFERASTPLSNACSETVVAANTPFCEFDDQVVWISPSLLFNRMVTAGVLP